MKGLSLPTLNVVTGEVEERTAVGILGWMIRVADEEGNEERKRKG